ncbi:hypothetical protein K3495_g2693 [Podosphaera aphanis]|nr:hypothetical protein K3495_g2693 [Podosphaera aphanis]
MSLDPPQYLSSLQNNIRTRPIAWEGAVRAGTISDEQLSKIRAVDKVRKDQRKQVIENDLEGYRNLFLGDGGKISVLEAATKRADVVQNILVLLSDLIDDIPAISKALSQHSSPYSIFVELLSHSNDPENPVPLLTSTVLTTIIAKAPNSSQKEIFALSELFKYLATLTRVSDGCLQDIAVLQYSELLREKKSRQLFWDQRTHTITPLVNILQAAARVSNSDLRSTLSSGTTSIPGNNEVTLGGGVGLQLLYHVLLVLWQLSFEASTIGKGLQEEYQIIPLLVQLLRLSLKEKITRLLVSSLYNLLSKNRQVLLPVAVFARLPALLKNLNARHLSDSDLLEDLSNLTEMIEEYTKNQTTFDEYAAEINSGHLRWSPPHKDQTFWAENSRKIFNHEKGILLERLAEIMAKPWENDKQVLAIGCNDIGSLVRDLPEKSIQLEKLGFKTRLIELMQEADESVRWESLHALSGWLKYSFES